MNNKLEMQSQYLMDALSSVTLARGCILFASARAGGPDKLDQTGKLARALAELENAEKIIDRIQRQLHKAATASA